MQRSFVLATFLLSLGAPAIAASGPVALDFTPLGGERSGRTSALASADVSFGVYPMSVFGIENAIRRYDGTKRLDDGPIAYAVLAIRDWETHYPHDPSIPRALLLLQRDYEHAGTFEGAEYARRIAAWLQTDYPSRTFAAMSRTELAKLPRAAEPEHRDVWARFRAPDPQPT